MEFDFNDGGTWRKITKFGFNDGGVWRTIQKAYFNDGGTWRQFFVYFTPSLTGQSRTDTGSLGSDGSSLATLSLNTDGTGSIVRSVVGDSFPCNWGSPTTTGIGASYWARVTITSGSLSSGTTGSWLQLNVARNWARNRVGGVGTNTCTFTLDIASDSGGASIVATASFTLTATLTA